MATLTPGMFPGDPARAAEAIYQVATADQPRHWVLLGSDALRRVGAKLHALRAEYEAGRELAFSTGTRGDKQISLMRYRRPPGWPAGNRPRRPGRLPRVA